MSNEAHTKMLTGKPEKVLFLFALPMILGNLFQQFYNIIDSVIVGNYVGETALASIGVSYAITMVFIAVATGGGIGCSVIIAQYLGSKQIERMKTAISTSLITILILSIFLGVVGFFMSGTILTWMNAPDNVFTDANHYLQIYFCGLPFLFMYNVLASIFNSLGDSKTPLILLIFSSILNIILDLVMVIIFHQGVIGVAIATLIAQGVSAIISFIILLYRLKFYSCKSPWKHYDFPILQKMIKIAIPSIVQQSIVAVGMLLVQSVVNGFGSSVLAGYTAGSRIESICIMPMLAVGNAMSTFTAQNIGAGKIDRVKQGFKAGFMIIIGLAVITLILLQIFGVNFVGGFLNESSTKIAYETGIQYMKFLSFFYVLIGFKATSDGVLRGAGDVVIFTISNLINLTIRVAIAFVFADIWGVQAVWIAVPMGWGANFIISTARYATGKWRTKSLI